MALTQPIDEYLAGLSASTTGISMSPGLNAAGSEVVKVNPALFNVKDYGAVGNGVADDTSEIQAAITAASAAGGGTVILPHGTYSVSATLVGQSYVNLLGLGRATLKMVAAPTLSANKCLLEFASETNFRVEGVTFDSSVVSSFSGGYREIFADQCSSFTIINNEFRAPGAAVANTASSNYIVAFNRVTISASDGTAHHDGIIDQWAGCNKFLILGNTIEGASVGKYGILVTGETTAGASAACYDFQITENKIYDVTQLGIWVNGREGVNYSFSIADNIIDNVTAFHGLSVLDAYAFTVTGNKIRDIVGQGMNFGKETAAGGVYGARDGVIANNYLSNVNTGATAGTDGAAISSRNTENSKLVFRDNIVRGSTHTYAMVVFGAAVEIVGKNFDAGTTGTISDSGTLTKTSFPRQYTPTATGTANVSAVTAQQATYTYAQDTVRVWGRIAITPTAAADTSTTVTLTLPVASNLGNASIDLTGLCASGFGQQGELFADVASDLATIRFPSKTTGAQTFSYWFEYKVI